jgi:hypothetical protein
MIEANAANPDQLPSIKVEQARRHVELVSLGQGHQLLKREGSDWTPKTKCPGQTELFTSVHGSSRFGDMRWLYNLLSGVAHGLAWASIGASRQEVVLEYLNYNSEGQPSASGVVLSKSHPDAFIAWLSLRVAILQVEDVLNKFAQARQLPPPTGP